MVLVLLVLCEQFEKCNCDIVQGKEIDGLHESVSVAHYTVLVHF